MAQQGYPPSGQMNVQYPPVSQQPMTTQQTTVIVQQPGQILGEREWSSNICGCFEDCSSCALSFFCPFCYMMHLYSRAGENCCAPCCVPSALTLLRTKVKSKHGIKGGICEDYCIGCFLGQCQLAQVAREMNEIEARGQAI